MYIVYEKANKRWKWIPLFKHLYKCCYIVSMSWNFLACKIQSWMRASAIFGYLILYVWFYFTSELEIRSRIKGLKEKQ